MNRLLLVEVICLIAMILISGSTQALSNSLSADMLAEPTVDSLGELAPRQVAENSSKSSSLAANADTAATVESASRTILVSEEYTAAQHSFNSTFFGDFKSLLLAEGYNVIVTNSTLSPSTLAGISVLIISMPESQYSASEIDAIEQFVSGGGSLFCIADCFDISRVDDLIKKWGFSQANGMVSDSNNYVDTQSWVYYEAARGNFADHPITSGLRRVLSGTSNWLLNPLPNNAVSIITTDNDGTASPSNVSIYAALDTGTGRIVISMDGNFFSHTPSGGKVGLAIDDNARLGLNTIDWLVHDLCDLTITSQDISFSGSGIPSEVVTITAVIHNAGEANAENVQVRFFDGQNEVGESSVPFLSHQSERIVALDMIAESGLHQIRISVDPEDTNREMDEDNNQATRSFLVGAWIRGGITLTGAINPVETSLGSRVNVSGTAVYSTDYGAGIPVAGADIYVVVLGQEWVTHTIADGTYAVSIDAPYSPGSYKLVVMITDYTFWEKIELDLTVGPVIGLDVAVGYNDLYLSPASPTKGDQVTVTAVVHNVGTEDASNVLVGFYDNYLLIGFSLIPVLPMGESKAATIVWQVSSWGWHTITAVIDPNDMLAEADELNNVAFRSVYVYPNLPDLAPRDITLSGGNPLVNQGTAITVHVANIGGVHAFNVVLRFYDNGIFFAERVIPFIAWKGGVEGVSVEYEFASVGWHELSVVVDPGGTIGEADENNNRLSTLVFVRAPAADLAVSWGDISFSNPSPADGDIITIYAQVHNIGELDAYSVVVEFVGIGRDTIPYIPSGETRVAGISWTATPAGPHWITVNADSEHTVPEFNEFNNVASRRIYVDPKGPFPDLSISSEDIAFSDPTPVPGEVVTISATIRNIGDAVAESVPVVFYVKNVQIAPIHMTPRLAPTENCIISTLWIAFPIGTHDVKVEVDPGHSIYEHRKDNNEAYREIYVYPSKPDLIPRGLALSDSSPATGQAIVISVEVQNLGGTSASNVVVNFYDDNQLIGNAVATWIDGRGGVTGVSVGYAFDSVGWHVLSVVVDPENMIDEAVDTNNDLSILVYVHSPAADLAISGNDITFSDSHPTDGDQIIVYAQVHNIGELDAYNVVVEFVGIGQVTIPHIPSSETRVASISWSATPTGFHGILVWVDPPPQTISESNEFNNIAFRGIIVYPPLPPDLLIYSSDILFLNSNPNPGEAVTIQATVHNIGSGEANDVSVTFTVDRGIPIETEAVAFIPAGGSQNVAAEWVATQPGSHVLTVVVDVAVDSNRNNNVATKAIVVPKHDFSVSVSPTQLSINKGESATCTVTLTSVGDFASELLLSVSVDPSTSDVTAAIDSDSVILTAGGSAKPTLTIRTTPEAPLKTFRIITSATGGGLTRTATCTASVEVFLEVPYQNQGQTSWCGPTSLAMILRYYGKEFHNWNYSQDENLASGEGVFIDPIWPFRGMEDYVADKYPELHTKIGKYDTSGKEAILTDIKSNVSSGFPLILKVGTWDPREGHYVVVVGYNETGLFVNDPSGALFVVIIKRPISGGTLNHAYVEWDTIREHIQTLPISSMMVVIGVADPLPGTAYFTTWKTGSQALDSDIAFFKKNNRNEYHFLDLDRGLQWKPDSTVEMEYSSLTAGIWVSNCRSTLQSLRASCRIVCPDDIIHPLGVHEYQVSAFHYVRSPWDLHGLGDILAKGGPYYIEFDLYDSDGLSIDTFSTPPFYWGQSETIILEEEQQHLCLHVYDAEGSHVGLNYTTNQTEIGIPGSCYDDDGNGTTIIVLPKIVNLTIVVDAKHAENQLESYNLTVTVTTDLGVFSSNCSGSIAAGEIQTFTTEVSDHNVVIIPEFPSFLVLPLFIVTTLLAMVLLKKRRHFVAIHDRF